MLRSSHQRALQSGLAATACLGLVAMAAEPAAAVENPTEWIRSIYAKYTANQASGNALDLFKPEASDRLRKSIAAEAACIKRTKGICGLDFDPIANGQDFEIKDVVVTSVAKVGIPTPEGRVTAKFSNFDKPQVIEFFFLKAGDGWLLDDVTSKTPGGKGWILSKLLGKAS